MNSKSAIRNPQSMPRCFLSRREFLALSGGAALTAGLSHRLTAGDAGKRRDGFLLSSAGCGRATGYAEASKIVTLGDRTHVAWLDADVGGFHVRIRTLYRSTGEWSQSWTVGAAHDNHGGPALIADSKGYLHILYFPHHQPFRYRRSLRPNDASEWESEIQFGAELSYPVLLCTPDDTLLMTTRRSHRGIMGPKQPWELELWKKPADGKWQLASVLLKSRHLDYAHFQESLAWGPDHKTIHLAGRIYETTGVKDEAPLQTVGYLVSPDSGQTWQRSDGTPVTVPATAETIDVLVRGGGTSRRTLYSGSIAVDRAGVPHRLVSVRENNRARSYLVTPDADGRGGWTKRDLHAWLPEHWRSADLVMPGAMSFSASGRATIVATLARLAAPTEEDWAHPSNEVVRFSSDDGCHTFRCEVIELSDAGRPRWLPNLERATGHHSIPDEPGMIFTAGSGGAGLNELELDNQVWWWSANRR
jgi:hypothetical protein